MHLIRIREVIGAAGDRIDTLHGISAGLSLHDTVLPWKDPSTPSAAANKAPNSNTSANPNPMSDYSFDGLPAVSTIIPPKQEQPPKTVKSIGLSPWNPPPPLLRQQGHLLYLQLTTNEGEQYQLTSHISGFFVNKSSNSKFDPYPRPAPKNVAAHSLFSLIANLSISFKNPLKLYLNQTTSGTPSKFPADQRYSVQSLACFPCSQFPVGSSARSYKDARDIPDIWG